MKSTDESDNNDDSEEKIKLDLESEKVRVENFT